MKTYLEEPYRENGFTCYPVMSYNENLDVDECVLTRVGTFSAKDGVDPKVIFKAIGSLWT